MVQMTVQEALKQGVEHQQAGRLTHAEGIYRQILAARPDDPNAMHLLGLVATQKGNRQRAIALIRRAIELHSNSAEMYFNLGTVLAETGQNAQAIAALRRAIELDPRLAAAHNNLGRLLRETGDLYNSVESIRRAVLLAPSAKAYANLGLSLTQLHQHEEAIAAHRKAVELQPNLALAHNDYGTALAKAGMLTEAIEAYHQAIRRDSFNAGFYSNLGTALSDDGQPEQAIIAQRQAIALSPNLAQAHANLAAALLKSCKFEEAIAAFGRTIVLKHDQPEAHMGLATALLLQGDFDSGWQEFEWRFRCKDFPRPINFHQPKWDGSPLDGRTLLIHVEQGLGDTIQFLRYLPLVLDRARGKVIVACQPELKRLVQSMSLQIEIVSRDHAPPPFDTHCALLSLPHLFKTTPQTIPSAVTYLHPDPADAAIWRERLQKENGRIDVGIVWAGHPRHLSDQERSIALDHLAPLANVSNVRFVSLQKGVASLEAKYPPAGMNLLDLSENLRDMADTAALIANLDLVVGVDTSVIHLAGALGKPVWVLIPFAPDWRWLLGRDDTPWYPTMRLFRQARRKDWQTVVEKIAGELSSGPKP
jgi:tetratricopeptide (TPR) repeat protein